MANSSIWFHNNRLIDILNIEKYNFTIVDFAHPLSLINRYTGHTKAPYSVAEHSFLGSYIPAIVEQKLARAFLIHDCSEALVNDIASPVKNQLPEYIAIEERIQRHIFRCFDEPWENMAALSPYDKNMCQDEMMQVFSVPHNIGRDSMGITVQLWDWKTAKQNFINRAKELDLAL